MSLLFFLKLHGFWDSENKFIPLFINNILLLLLFPPLIFLHPSFCPKVKTMSVIQPILMYIHTHIFIFIFFHSHKSFHFFSFSSIVNPAFTSYFISCQVSHSVLKKWSKVCMEKGRKQMIRTDFYRIMFHISNTHVFINLEKKGYKQIYFYTPTRRDPFL